MSEMTYFQVRSFRHCTSPIWVKRPCASWWARVSSQSKEATCLSSHGQRLPLDPLRDATLPILLLFLIPLAPTCAPNPVQDLLKQTSQLTAEGRLLRSQAQPDQSIASLEKALTLAAQAPHFPSHKSGWIHFALALAYSDKSASLPPAESSKVALIAASHFEQTLTLWRDDLHVTQIHRSVARLNLAHAYDKSGRFTDALSSFQAALPDIERHFGTNSAQFASALGGLAYTYVMLNRLEEAKTTWRKSLSIYRTRKTHVDDVIVALYSLGEVYVATEDYAQGVAADEEAAHIAESQHGTDSPALIAPLSQLALAFNYKGEPWRNGAIYDRIEAICLRHPGSATVCESGGSAIAALRGSSSYERGDYKRASQEYRRWIDNLQNVDIANDPRLAQFQMISEQLASIYERFGDYHNAAAIRARRVEVYGRHPSLSRTVSLEQMQLASDYEHTKDPTSADELYRIVVPLLESQLVATATARQSRECGFSPTHRHSGPSRLTRLR